MCINLGLYYLHLSPTFLCSQVIEVLAAIRNESKEALADTIYKNTLRMFFPDAAAD